MDGVLFDSMPLHAKAWVAAMNEIGLPFTEYQVYQDEGCTGTATVNKEFLKHFGRLSTPKEDEEIYAIKSKVYQSLSAPSPMPYAFEVVKKLENLKIEGIVVTGSGEKTTINRVEQYFPHLFERQKMVTAYDVKKGKPDAEPYLMGLKKAQAMPNEAIVIENAPLGIQAGVAAGIFTIGVNTGILKANELRAAGANLVFPSMRALCQSIKEIVI